MKKLQESQGQVNYGELSEYIKNQVQLQSVKTNGKDQNPTVIISSDIADDWKNFRFK
jgi:hypothetical protein